MSSYLTKNSGFSIIEILVTVIVLSVGLLSLGGLQITALKKTNDAHFRTEASLLLMDLSNKMRSNPEGMIEVIDTQGDTTINISCQTDITSCSGITMCDQKQLVTFNLNEIACRLTEALPEGKLEVTRVIDPILSCDAAAGDTRSYYSMELKWIEMGEKDVNSSLSTEKDVNITCFTP